MKMKKLLILLFCTFAYNCNILADEKFEIDLKVGIIDNSPTRPKSGKAPIQKPRVYQEANKLIFPQSHPEYIINIVKDDEVVFTSSIPDGVSEYFLPSYIADECMLQIINGKFCFWGFVSF